MQHSTRHAPRWLLLVFCTALIALLSACGSDGTTKSTPIPTVGSGSSNAPTPTLDQPYIYNGHAAGVFAVAWSPDGKRIASGSADNTVQVWDATDGVHRFTYHGHSNAIEAIAWSPDGKRIASASGDPRPSDEHTVQVWTYSGS